MCVCVCVCVCVYGWVRVYVRSSQIRWVYGPTNCNTRCNTLDERMQNTTYRPYPNANGARSAKDETNMTVRYEPCDDERKRMGDGCQ